MRKNIYVLAVLFLMKIISCGAIPDFDKRTDHYYKADEKLDILIVTDVFPHQSRQYINNQITGFIEMGHNVFILVQHQDDNQVPRAQDPIIEKYNLSGKIFYEKLPKYLRDFDILYCQFGQMGDYCLSLIEKKKLTGKMVVCFRGGDATRALRENSHRFDKVFKYANLLLPVCHYFKDRLLLCGAKEYKTIVHHSGINCKEIAFKQRTMPEDGIIKFVTIGRLAKMKGIEYAVRAIARIKRVYPHVTYDIIGDGELYDSLQHLINTLQLQDTVKLIGYLPHHEVIQRLSHYHIALIPSCTADDWNQEGIPNAAMEAMASGMPVIGTHHAGMPELIEEGISGFLVPEKDVAALSDKIFYIINNPQLWEVTGTAGRAYILREHNKDFLNKRIISIFKELVREEA